VSADLGAQEPLAAAGVPPEERLFDVTVANILQVRLMLCSACCVQLLGRAGMLDAPGMLHGSHPQGQGLAVQAYMLTHADCMPLPPAGSAGGVGAPPSCLHAPWRPAGAVR
jgi:hypothetical protein